MGEQAEKVFPGDSPGDAGAEQAAEAEAGHAARMDAAFGEQIAHAEDDRGLPDRPDFLVLALSGMFPRKQSLERSRRPFGDVGV